MILRNDDLFEKKIDPSSFRDRSGFIFYRGTKIFRQINNVYKAVYDEFVDTGLYKELVNKNLLIEHEEVDVDNAISRDAYKVIKPQAIPFISYPYEWCFSQYKNSALLTLEIQRIAFNYGMTLKDASAYNIQFLDGQPILIDTLSFDKYKEGEPWVAYRQFCQHFLAPLALMCYKDIRLSQLMKVFIDGIPLDLASTLLPFSTKTKFSLLSHIHLHSKAQDKYADKDFNQKKRKISNLGLIGIIDSLKSAVQSLKLKHKRSTWSDYYDETHYTERGFNHKKETVSNLLDEIKDAEELWDFGSNTGEFSRIASSKGLQTTSFDVDPFVVEKNYLNLASQGYKNILPLFCDLTNPSPNIGWENKERLALFERGPVDIILALALIHHLAISNNIPMYNLAKFFSAYCDHLIIEFVPKSDTKVQQLLSTREDIFKDYTQESFENEFKKFFLFSSPVNIKDSKRSIYLMKKRHDIEKIY